MKIEGKNSVRELVKSGKTIDKVLVANGMRDAESKMLVSVIIAYFFKYRYFFHTTTLFLTVSADIFFSPFFVR